MLLSVIIPVFNEENTVAEIIGRVSKVDIPKQVIVVDDGSIDNTASILKSIQDQSGFILVCHHKNRGKGSAIKTALEYVKGDVVVIQDADLEYNPDDYRVLMEPISDGTVEIVYGSRNRKPHRKLYFLNNIGNSVLTWSANLLYGAGLTDISTGYKMFRTKVLKNLNFTAPGFEFEQEITALALKRGYHIKEVSVSYKARTYAQGKKIRWPDGLRGLLTLLKHRLIN